MPIDITELSFGNPVKDIPASKAIAPREPGELSRKIIAGVLGLRAGEYLPVVCGSQKEANKLQSRKTTGLFKRYGVSCQQRGTTVYFYRNGTH